MSTDDPELPTVTSEGLLTIPSRLRKQFGLVQGTTLLVVPTDVGLVLKKLERSPVEEFQRRVEGRTEGLELSPEEIDRLVHEARESNA